MKNLKILFLAIILLACYGCAEKKTQEISTKAAAFRLLDTDSVYKGLGDFKGNVIMLHFWADWCPHCRQEFPELENAYRKLHKIGLEIVGINSGQPFNHVTGIQQEFGLSFPLLIDEEAITAKKYKVAGLPSSIFIDSRGQVHGRETGWMTEEKITEIFNRLRAE